MNSSEAGAEAVSSDAAAAQKPKLTGAQKDWLWIRRGAVVLTFVGAPIIFAHQVRAEVLVRQFLHDVGYEHVVDWLRANAAWLNIPVDVPDEYRHVERPAASEGGTASHALPLHELRIRRPGSLDIPVRSYDSIETRESLQSRISVPAHSPGTGTGAHVGHADGLQKAALQQRVQADAAESKRLAKYVQVFNTGAMWRPTVAIERSGQAALAAASAPPPGPGDALPKAPVAAAYTGSSSALVMDACEHLNDEYEHTTVRLNKRPASQQLVPSAQSEEAIGLRLRAIRSKLQVAS